MNTGTKYVLRKYLEKGAWPIMSCQTRKDRACGDNYGDAECPFCDYVFKAEGDAFEIGEMCRRCNAVVTGVDLGECDDEAYRKYVYDENAIP